MLKLQIPGRENKLSNPAIKASEEALKNLFQIIDSKKCFRFEAGAGAGKTYSLIKALQYLIGKNSGVLLKNNQQIACITYTNVAVEQISIHTDHNPIIFAGTIHAFGWGLIKGLQKQMLSLIPNLSDRWKERIEESGGIKQQIIKYDLGHPRITEEEISLHHDDVIKIFSDFLYKDKFKSILFSRFPIILIDEYQDTNKTLADSIVHNLIENDKRFLIGLFGDHWQKIYGSDVCGLITSSEGKIVEIKKNANFRSDKNIVESLNRIRPDLPQNEKEPNSTGEITVFLSNEWKGARRKDNHWQGDLPSDIAHAYLVETQARLIKNGWDFDPNNTKILMLTNNVLADEQGYRNLTSIFRNTDDYLKKNDPYIAFLSDYVEPVCSSFEKKKYGEMFKAVGLNTIQIKKHEDKLTWIRDIRELINIRNKGTIGDVIEFLKKTEKPHLSSKVESAEKKWLQLSLLTDKEELEKEKDFFEKIISIKALKYSELIALSKYLDDKTPFSTKHGVKGAEFENVLVVFGRGWNNYNWNDFLEWSKNGIKNGKEESYERNRNLFYVSCSRPKKRLALLVTQLLSESSVEMLKLWFGPQNISSLTL